MVHPRASRAFTQAAVVAVLLPGEAEHLAEVGERVRQLDDRVAPPTERDGLEREPNRLRVLPLAREHHGENRTPHRLRVQVVLHRHRLGRASDRLRLVEPVEGVEDACQTTIDRRKQ